MSYRYILATAIIQICLVCGFISCAHGSDKSISSDKGQATKRYTHILPFAKLAVISYDRNSSLYTSATKEIDKEIDVLDSKPNKTPKERLRLANLHIRAGNFLIAQQEAKKILQKNFNFVEAAVLLGQTFLLLGKDEKARSVCERLMKSKIERADVWNLVGLYHLKKQEFSAAIKAFSKSYQLKKSDSAAGLNLAITYIQFGNYADAESLLKNLEEGSLIKPDAMQLRAVLYIKQNLYKRADDLLTSWSIKESASYFYNLSLVKYNLKDYGASLKALDKFLDYKKLRNKELSQAKFLFTKVKKLAKEEDKLIAKISKKFGKSKPTLATGEKGNLSIYDFQVFSVEYSD